MQIRKKVDRIGRSCTEGILMEVAKELEIPEDVLDNIKQEFGGHKRQLMEVLEVWRVHRGPEATVAVADDVIRKATNKPQQVETTAPQSLVGATAAFTGSETPPVITQPNSTLFPDVDETMDRMGNLDLAPDDTMDGPEGSHDQRQVRGQDTAIEQPTSPPATSQELATQKEKSKEEEMQSLPSVPTHAVNGGKEKTSRRDKGQPLSTDV